MFDLNLLNLLQDPGVGDPGVSFDVFFFLATTHRNTHWYPRKFLKRMLYIMSYLDFILDAWVSIIDGSNMM